MNRKFLYLIVAFLVIGAFFVWRTYNKPHQDFQEKDNYFQGESVQLFELVMAQPDTLLSFKNKAVEISGSILSAESRSFTMEGNISVELDSTQSMNQIEVGKIQTIKGRFVGYDDLFGEVKIDQAVVK